MKFKQLIIIFLVLFFKCKKNTTSYEYLPKQIETINKKSITEDNLKIWFHKDIVNDSIPGISLYKAYNTILKNNKSKDIVVAVLDQVVDINHKDLKQNIWLNNDEYLNNEDDDKNGYIDDTNGWDFLGNGDGIDTKYNHFDFTRIVKEYDNFFKDKTINDIDPKDSLSFLRYKRAKRKLAQKIKSIPEQIEYANNVSKWKNRAKNSLLKYLNYSSDFKFTTKILDSLTVVHEKDSTLLKDIQILSGFISNGYSDEYIGYLKLNSSLLLDKQLNIEYNEREFLGDNPNDINDINYGYNKVDNNINIYPHGTIISGVIAKETPEIKIMPLCILGHGSFNDKDLALAIRYAVDNGAKVINMSFGKDFSINKHMVDDAFKYAEKNNVLIITSAGNDFHDMDSPKKYNYPSDLNENKKEFVDNFIKVGGSTRYANENLNYEYSNYGKLDVDVFAPAEEIYTTLPNNEYKYDTGTSLASALTSKVAALIFSYYPNLTASQVKYIIMDSGVEYTFHVKMPILKNEERRIPFNELSKSGKIINAYNALIMADSISKKNN